MSALALAAGSTLDLPRVLTSALLPNIPARRSPPGCSAKATRV
jgi:hypothetical protein